VGSERKNCVLTEIPKGGGVQVLPVQWRHKISFGRKEIKERNERRGGTNENPNTITDEEESKSKPAIVDEGPVVLEDLTLAGVPTIRALAGDVILDVLLYLTPRHRQEMIFAVTDELNRIYKLFTSKNPTFKGKVSIYSHSLGSLLAFDILCNQQNALSFRESLQNVPQIDLGDVKSNIESNKKEALSVTTDRGLIDDAPIKYKKLEFVVDRFYGKDNIVFLNFFITLFILLLRAIKNEK